MDQHTYIDQLEKLYVLMETRHMLKEKIEVSSSESAPAAVLEDIKKIEEEIAFYSGGQSIEEIEASLNAPLFNPSYVEEEES
ncbi:hypothetical protein [Bacillus sp. FJAT-44742]|uniref:hypothetical protein n=1 Tax=Bacillus sp. FJAT-44742 TaxID=2014005 RepID=UPI000C24E6AC|nr:hypothetical protein [Bacillus sp. FJAT-44742]